MALKSQKQNLIGYLLILTIQLIAPMQYLKTQRLTNILNQLIILMSEVIIPIQKFLQVMS